MAIPCENFLVELGQREFSAGKWDMRSRGCKCRNAMRMTWARWWNYALASRKVHYHCRQSARDLPRKALANILAVTQFTSHVACPQKYTHRRSSFSICKQTGSDMGSLHHLLRLAIPGQWPKIAGPVGPGQHVRPINGTIKSICTWISWQHMAHHAIHLTHSFNYMFIFKWHFSVPQ